MKIVSLFLFFFISPLVFAEGESDEVWGVRGLQLLIEKKEGISQVSFELDCAHGFIPSLKIEENGYFYGEGEYVLEGGPVEGTPAPLKGFFMGRKDQNRMVFTVDLPESSRSPVVYELKLNTAADLVKCL